MGSCCMKTTDCTETSPFPLEETQTKVIDVDENPELRLRKPPTPFPKRNHNLFLSKRARQFKKTRVPTSGFL